MAVGGQRGGDECASDGDCGDAMQCDLGVCTEIRGVRQYGELISEGDSRPVS